MHKNGEPPRDGSVRVLYAARVGHCRACPLREQCQGYGTATKKPRRKSRRAVASRWSTSRTCRSPCACSSLSCNPVGRLEPMPDATRVDDSTTHTNRHHHRPACRVLCRDSSKASAHAATTGALAAQLGRATGTQCPSKDCSRCGDHPVRSAFAFCYFPGSVDPLRTCARISRSVGTSRFPGTCSACLADGPGSSARSSTKPAAQSRLRYVLSMR